MARTSRAPRPAKPRKQAARPAPSLPSLDELRRFVREAPGRVGKREIARHFGLGPEHRGALKGLMHALASKGEVAAAGKKRFTAPGRMPEAIIVEVTGTDPDGDPIARPVDWEGPGRPPTVFMAPERRGRPALAPGERVLARIRPAGPDKWEGRTLKRIQGAGGRVLGILRNGRIVPTDRRQKAEWRVPAGEAGGAEDGELVLAEPLPHPGLGLRPARVIERLGKMGEPRSVSLLCIHTHGIPEAFPDEALAQADKARGVAVRGREDLRDLPLVTIDGEDARDFDDAVFAEPDGRGWRLVVAIADVAHYVPPGSPLDRAAFERGNSVYFPDRVVPMLPEELSNGWCSLRPDEDRGCLFVEMRVGRDGRKTAHRFGRGVMRSAARLTYEQVQAARADTAAPFPLPRDRLDALYGAFTVLLEARTKRGTLDLDLPERKVILDGKGGVAAVVPRPRLDSHRLIEEFMVLANVAAAEELEHLVQPCMYRVHDRPSPEKLLGLRDFLHTMSISLPPGDQVHPRDIDRILRKVAGTPQAPLVNEVVLRSQAQARYSPDNIGHFGLALTRYAHFTSPIRRYADLLVHRALIRGLKLGKDGLDDAAAARFPDAGEHITVTERRAALAERDAIDRYLALYMADKVGAQFDARISGVTRFGLFVTVADSGANGLVPVSTLPEDFYVHDETAQALVGRRTRRAFRLADTVSVRLAEASPVTGGLVFRIVDGRPRGVRPKR